MKLQAVNNCLALPYDFPLHLAGHVISTARPTEHHPMNLTIPSFHLPFLLAQADTPTETPDATPSTESYMTINGQQATPEQIAKAKSIAMIGGLVGLVLGLILVAAVWKVFTKAGKPGWASLVPIYNAIVLLEIAGRPVWWFILLFIPGVNLIIMIIVMIDVAKNFGHGAGFGLGLALLSPIFLLILGFGSSRYVGPGGGALAGGYPPGGYPPATM